MQMLKGARAQKAGIVYLQDEKYEFKAHENGKLWSVYGSPVRIPILTFQAFQLFDEDESFSGVLNFSTGRSIMNGKRLKVGRSCFLSVALCIDIDQTFRDYHQIPQD